MMKQTGKQSDMFSCAILSGHSLMSIRRVVMLLRPAAAEGKPASDCPRQLYNLCAAESEMQDTRRSDCTNHHGP